MSMLASALLFVGWAVAAQHMKDDMGMHTHAYADCHHPMMKGMEKRLSQMKTKLHLNADQQPAWEAYSKSMTTLPEQAKNAMQDEVAMSKLTTPERLEKMNAFEEAHVTSMQAHMKLRHEAILKFYNQLSTDQKKTFDMESWHFHQRH